MEKTISLAKAMRVQSELKNKVAALTELFELAPRCVISGERPDYANSGGMSQSQILIKGELIDNVISQLRKQINKANQKPSEILVDINRTLANIMRYEHALLVARRTPKKSIEENRITGEKTTVLYDVELDTVELGQKIKWLKMEKFNLETSLSDCNATTKVDLDVSLDGNIDSQLYEAITEILEN